MGSFSTEYIHSLGEYWEDSEKASLKDGFGAPAAGNTDGAVKVG